jgi:hypothetical protein
MGLALTAACVGVAAPAPVSRSSAAPFAGEEPQGRAPRLLSETGLYRLDGSVDPRNRPFAPQYPLWSDGADKSRWARLPEGETIDVSDVDAWRFPPGTTFWKEFAWGGRRIETRMIRSNEDGDWTFATYVWKEDQSDAVLAPVEGIPGHFEIAPGKRHSIPAVADCDACHRPAPSAALGFTALQLSDDRDPLAPHAVPVPVGGVTLRTLLAENRLSPPRPELAARPPRIRAGDPVARAAIGYLSANCGGCHNQTGPLGRLGFAFLHDEASDPSAPEPAVLTAVASHGRFLVPGVAPDSSYIVAPGAPDRSGVVYRMKSRRPSSQMPPLGTVIRDDAALELVRRWIERLTPGSPQGDHTKSSSL